MQLSFSLILLAGVAFWVAAGLKCYECFDSECNDESKFTELNCDDKKEACISAYYNKDDNQFFSKTCGDEEPSKNTCNFVTNTMDGVCYTCNKDFCNKSSNDSQWIS
ncbi:hypothetical protein MTP99_017935 [Tenebrio molitor]|nr:hypothetical protein MTP99_017935 [Tenebrio molitor]